jgi:hypothetical protein
MYAEDSAQPAMRTVPPDERSTMIRRNRVVPAAVGVRTPGFPIVSMAAHLFSSKWQPLLRHRCRPFRFDGRKTGKRDGRFCFDPENFFVERSVSLAATFERERRQDRLSGEKRGSASAFFRIGVTADCGCPFLKM